MLASHLLSDDREISQKTGFVERTGVDAVGVLVGDLDAELLLDGHDDLDGVEAVETEVVGEVGGGLDVGRVVDLEGMG